MTGSTQYITFILILLCTDTAWSQPTKGWFHLGTAMNAYKGDLSGFDQYNSSFHIGIQLNRKEKLNGNVTLGFGNVTGQNRNFNPGSSQNPPPVPNRFFKSNFFYINYDVHYNIIKKQNFILYVSQGIGIIRFNPKDDAGNSLQDLPNTREEQETYRNAALMLPTSVGALYLLPNQYGVALQTGFYNPLTDYLDNISNLGNTKNDNILGIRFAFYVPIKQE